jgi:glycosyltransferase involved in cell wall biosynthesis
MPSLTVLSIHNFYQQPGGEDHVFATEADLLERQGHRVIRYQDHNHRIGNGAIAGLAAIWNHASYRRIQSAISEHRPDVAHFHNTFPLISPAAYYAVRRLGVPVVQKLSNFRLLCPGGIFLRDGQPCEQCLEHRSLRPALTHKCYRGSRAATAAVIGMLAAHRAVGTWERMVDVYIALSEFARRKFIEGGLPAARIVVKGNCVTPDPGPGQGNGAYALFVGRLSEEKGIATLAEAWRRLPDIPLRIAGDGPLNQTKWPAGVTWLGHQSRDEVIGLMKNAAVLVFPSVCYECAPLTILEAFACGLPVIASDVGSVPEFVADGRNGFLFRPGDADDLARQVRRAFEHPTEMKAMRTAARREFETKHTAQVNYTALLEIYDRAIENYARTRGARTPRVGSPLMGTAFQHPDPPEQS